MTQIIDLGKLRFHFAGEWLDASVYEPNDVVKYGGNIYVYIYGMKMAGNLPTLTSHWALMVKGFDFNGVFDAATAYRVGEAISYGGKVYISIADSVGQVPPNSAVWSQFVDGIQFEGEYAAETAFQKNDVVTYGGSTYTAILDTVGNLPSDPIYWKSFVAGVNPKTAYDLAEAYVKNDIVTYGGSTYVAMGDTTGDLPSDTNYWQPFTYGIKPQGFYLDSKSYVKNDVVTYGGDTYVAQGDTLGNAPTVEAFWTVFTSGIRRKGVWETAVVYYPNDAITHGGNTYICLELHTATAFPADLATTQWQKFNSGVRWVGTWASGADFLKDDIIKDAVGSAYIATADHQSSISFDQDRIDGNWEVFAVGGADVLPAIGTDGINGRSLSVSGDGASVAWIGATESSKVIYVAPHGVDEAGYGSNLSTPYASLKFACLNAPESATIFVKSGNYFEQLPIIVPAHVAIVGDNQRTTIIAPAGGLSDDGVTQNTQSSMFFLSNGSILNKMTFKGMTGWIPGATPEDVTTSTAKGVFVRLNPESPVTTKSPYVLECSAIGSGAIGALVEGSVHASGARTMIFHGYTIISDNGVGYWVRDGAKAEIVSCFTYYCFFGYTASGGSQIRALNGNNSYGTWGATSRGFDATEVAITGKIFGEQMSFVYDSGTIAVGDTVSNEAGSTAVVVNIQYSADKLYISDRVGEFTSGELLTSSSGGLGTVLTGAVEDQKGFVLVLTNLTNLPVPGSSISLAGDTSSYVIQSVSGDFVNSTSKVIAVLAQEKPSGSADGTAITIRSKYSQVRLTGHDFLSVGTGGLTTTNYPNTPTQAAAPGNETDEAYPGRVYYVSTDQDGNFRVGEYFRIDQATGKATLNASAFDLSGLSSLRLGSIGAQLGEAINEFSSDATLSGNSNIAVPTEYSVKTYVDTEVLASAKAVAESIEEINFLTTISSDKVLSSGRMVFSMETLIISGDAVYTISPGSYHFAMNPNGFALFN